MQLSAAAVAAYFKLRQGDDLVNDVIDVERHFLCDFCASVFSESARTRWTTSPARWPSLMTRSTLWRASSRFEVPRSSQSGQALASVTTIEAASRNGRLD